MLLAALAAGLTGAISPAIPSSICRDLLPVPVSGAKQAVTANDLVRVRETGWGDGDPGAPPPMTLSPDGRRLAVVVRRGDPESNGICVGLIVIALDTGTINLVDASGVLLRDEAPWNGLLGMPSGRPLFNQPRWSPDGQRLFYLKAAGKEAQVWKVDLPTSTTSQVTSAKDGVIHFGLAGGGSRIVYSSRAGHGAARERLMMEGRTGWVYDGRFAPIFSLKPYVTGINASAHAVGPDGSDEQPATAEEIAESGVRLNEVSDAFELLPAHTSWRVARALVRPDRPFGPSRLMVAYRGRALRCREQVCGARVFAAVPVGDTLAILREAVDRAGDVELVTWHPGRRPRVIRSSADMLAGCIAAPDALLCLEEGSTLPPRIVRVALTGAQAGKPTVLADLNPEFRRRDLGPVQRLRWTDRNGIAAYGDLVLPPDHKAGEQHPLIIVQYISRGFLRGGSGNEYPIYPLAAHGFAVLSVNAPRRAVFARAADATSSGEFQVKMYEDLWQRRALHVSLDAGIDAAIATGLVDPSRIGLTGMSDGAATAIFALIHNPRYAAVAISGSGNDPVSYSALVAPVFSTLVKDWGFPAPDEQPGFWRQLSLARNADRITVPLLIQTSDAELRVSLEAFDAFQRKSRPIEMLVYPDEYHNKWQPAHIKAVYETSIDWFSFWLRQVIPPDADRARRWTALAGNHSGPAQRTQ